MHYTAVDILIDDSAKECAVLDAFGDEKSSLVVDCFNDYGFKVFESNCNAPLQKDKVSSSIFSLDHLIHSCRDILFFKNLAKHAVFNDITKTYIFNWDSLSIQMIKNSQNKIKLLNNNKINDLTFDETRVVKKLNSYIETTNVFLTNNTPKKIAEVSCAYPLNVLLPQGYSESTEIWMQIASNLLAKDLLSMRQTSKHKKVIAERALIDHLNAGSIIPYDLGIRTVTNLIDSFEKIFGENCSEITYLMIRGFDLENNDFGKLSNIFKKLNRLMLRGAYITDDSFTNLKEMVMLKDIDLSNTNIDDISCLQHCKNLKVLSLLGCKIKNLSYLQHCKELASLDLSHWQIEDLNFLQHCTKFTSLNLSHCKIKDFNFLQYCKNLTSLNLSDCKQIKDLSFLQHCKELTSLNLSSCNLINDFNFLQHCKNLKDLNLSSCGQINNLSFLQHCTKLESLDLSSCQIEDFKFLHQCTTLKDLDLVNSKFDDLNFFQYCTKLTSINISYTSLTEDIRVGILRSKGVKVFGYSGPNL